MINLEILINKLKMFNSELLNQKHRSQSPLHTNSAVYENNVGCPKKKRRRYNAEYSIGDTQCNIIENNQRSSPVRRRVTKVQS
jgi:hypothetical protein